MTRNYCYTTTYRNTSKNMEKSQCSDMQMCVIVIDHESLKYDFQFECGKSMILARWKMSCFQNPMTKSL